MIGEAKPLRGYKDGKINIICTREQEVQTKMFGCIAWNSEVCDTKFCEECAYNPEKIVFHNVSDNIKSEENPERVEQLKKENRLLRKALMEATGNKNPNGIRIPRELFCNIFNAEIEDMLSSDFDENEIYGYPVAIHWHGMYCECGDDGAGVANYIIPAVMDLDKELDDEIKTED